MKLPQILLVIVISAAVSLATVYVFSAFKGSPQRAVKESAYERVMRTGTLRCGWLLYPNFFERDVNTGAFSGIYYDLLEEMGRQLSLKIEWAEEVSTADALAGLGTGRYDVVCSPFVPTPGRAREAEFTVSMAYRPYYAYVRADDKRFDNDYKKIDDPSVKLVSVEGEFAQTVAKEKFPKAQNVLLPALSDFTQDELTVATGKADVSLAEIAKAEKYMKKNPGAIRQVFGPPIYMCPVTLLVPVGEHALKSLLNTTIETMHASGVIQKIYEKYLGKPGRYYFMPERVGQ